MIKIKGYIEEKVNELSAEIVKSTQEVLRIKSVKEKKEKNMPFGKGINECLETTLSIAESLDLSTNNIDGYAGHVEIGEGQELIGVLCHLDVVPEGQDWTYPPYGGEIHEGKIYGRGSIDDKGPAIAVLYALKCLKDSGTKLGKRVRLILGTDEESGWQGLDYYLQKEETPDLAFTPDAEFPIINGEKGILHIRLVKKINSTKSEKIDSLRITGGNAINMVPDFCSAVIKTHEQEQIKDSLQKYLTGNNVKLELETRNDSIIINSYGVSAHGSLPADGINAVSQLIVFLRTLDIFNDEIVNIINFYSEKIGMEITGEGMGCNYSDTVSGNLTFNVGKIDLSEDGIKMCIDIRYPVTVDKEIVSNSIKKTSNEYNFQYNELSHKAPLYVQKSDPLVENLMRVYQEYTEDMSKPITIGGGTYARGFKKAVAFGPLLPGKPELAHQKDEYIEIDDLILITKIYASAILELAKS